MSEAGPPRDEHKVAIALREALRTRRHGELVFDSVRADLGERARVHVFAKGKIAELFVREAEGSPRLVPWPLLTRSRLAAKRLDIDLGLGPPVEIPERPEVAPNLRDLGPGHLKVHDGPDAIQVTYREDGLWKETSRSGPPSTLRDLLPALEGEEGTPADRVATFVRDLDIGRHGGGRLLEPLPHANGPRDAWMRGLRTIRTALHARHLPETPGVAVADGIDGSVCVHGATEDAALEAWRAGVLEHAAKRTSDDAWRERTPDDVPAVLIPIEPCAHPQHPWGTWAPLLGPCGETVFALRRFGPDGLILVGEDILSRVDLEHLEADLDRADERLPPPPEQDPSEAWRGEREPYLNSVVTYRLEDDPAGGRPRPRWERVQRGPDFDPGTALDGARIRSRILRQRWA